MRRTQRILLASLLGPLCASEALAQSGPLDARAVRPAVMLLVDTSGSMERLPATAASDDSPLPTCSGSSAADSLQKNRWALTLEALTGSFQNFTCRAVDRTGSGYAASDYDYGYYLPHIDFGTNPPQNPDGLLDSFANRVKFGLMTFDGVGTTIGGETLVPLSDFYRDPYMTQVKAAPGMYSYGDIGRLSFPGCLTDYGVNAGARGEGNHPGALVSVGNSENVDDILAVNARVQSSLLSVRPFGGTPIPAMLDDLKYYIQHHADISASSDRFYGCRERTAILITDGAPDALFRDSRFQCDSTAHSSCASNSIGDAGTGDAGAPAPGECHCPYEPADLIASQLLHDGLLDKLIVVAYNVREATALATLETIAAAGWPPADLELLGTTPYPHLVRANGPVELRNLLDDVLRSQQPGVTSRSVPISVNTGNATTGPDSKRFDITAGFQLGEDEDQPWTGYLYRRRILCGGTDGTTVDDNTPLDAEAGDDLGFLLNRRAPSTRDLFTATPQSVGDVNGTLRNRNYRPAPVYSGEDSSFSYGRLPTGYDSHNDRRPDGSTFSTAELVAVDGSMSSTQALASDLITPRVPFTNALNSLLFGASVNDAGRRVIVDYVRGDSRPGRVLADIYHSNPVALLPLNSASTARFADINASYSNWLRKIIAPATGARYGTDGRPGLIFVGTNDGVLHAFNLDSWQNASGGSFEGGEELWGFVPPALFGKLQAAAAAHQFMFDGTPEVKDVVLQKREGGAPVFRTVLLSAVRGTPAFVALDVTFPEEPVFLWQASFGDVGETVGNPAITQVEVDWLGERQQRAVAILPGGRGTASASCPTTGYPLVNGRTRAAFPVGNNRNVRCWQRRGRALYVVDVATGQLLQEFGPEHFPSPLTGSVVVDSASVGTASAAYFFDHDGVLWRLSMIGTDPGAWRAAPIYDTFANPAFASVSPTPNSWQIGRVPQYAPALTRDRLGNLVILAGSGEVDNPLDTALQRVLSLTERRVPESDGQIGGTVTLNWLRDLEANESVTGPLTVFENTVYFATFLSEAGANQCALGRSYRYAAHTYEPEDPLVAPGRPQPKLLPENAGPNTVPVLREEVDTSGSNLVIGLTIARQPTCRNTNVIPNAVTGQMNAGGASGGGLYQLRAMMAGSSSGGTNPGGGAVKEMTARTIQVTHPASVSAWAGSVD